MHIDLIPSFFSRTDLRIPVRSAPALPPPDPGAASAATPAGRSPASRAARTGRCAPRIPSPLRMEANRSNLLYVHGATNSKLVQFTHAAQSQTTCEKLEGNCAYFHGFIPPLAFLHFRRGEY